MKVEKSIEISASPEKIWPFLVDPAKIVMWFDSFKKCEYTNEKHSGVGTTYYVEEKVPGPLRKINFEAIIWDGNRVNLNMKRAGFPVKKQIEEFNFVSQTTITKKQINRLLDFSYIDNRENIVFIGPPGVGKTHLAIGISYKSVHAGYKVLFTTALELIEILDLAEAKGELKKKINAISKFDTLVIDELGYLPMNKQSMFNFFQLINALYEYRSIIITTNKDFTNWGDFFFDDNVAVPIVDRIIHHSHIFMMGGESYRLKQKININ